MKNISTSNECMKIMILSKMVKQAGAELCQSQYKLELAKLWFGFVASLKFDCLVQTGVVAIVSNQILSLDKCCMEKCCTDRCCMDKCCTDRCCMDKCCMDKCCMVKWYWATCQQSRMLYQLSLLSLNYYPGGVGGWLGGWIKWE